MRGQLAIPFVRAACVPLLDARSTGPATTAPSKIFGFFCGCGFESIPLLTELLRALAKIKNSSRKRCRRAEHADSVVARQGVRGNSEGMRKLPGSGSPSEGSPGGHASDTFRKDGKSNYEIDSTLGWYLLNDFLFPCGALPTRLVSGVETICVRAGNNKKRVALCFLATWSNVGLQLFLVARRFV